MENGARACTHAPTGLLLITWPHCAVCVCMDTRQGVEAVIEKDLRRCSQVIVSGCFEEPVGPVWTEFPLSKSLCMGHVLHRSCCTSIKIILGCFFYSRGINLSPTSVWLNVLFYFFCWRSTEATASCGDTQLAAIMSSNLFVTSNWRHCPLWHECIK